MNDSAFLYYQANFERIKQICLPLKNLGINGFEYIQIYMNSKYFYFSSDFELTKELFFIVEKSHLFFKEYLPVSDPSKNTYFILWPDEPYSKDLAMNLHIKYNYWNGISVLKVNDQFIEAWAFLAKTEDYNAQLFYKQHTNLLLEFINHFNYAMQEFMQGLPANLALFKKSFDFQLPVSFNNPEIQQANIQNFLKCLYPKGLKIQTRNGITKLTHAEVNCLRLLAKGNSAKEIARNLNISNRTVEAHINHIKIKSGYNLKTDLISFFSEQVEGFLPTNS